MAKQRVEIEVDVPSGWELTGEYRHAQTYDYYMPQPDNVAQWLDYSPTEDAVLIVRPLENARPASIEEA
jgi:hypothetical protein